MLVRRVNQAMLKRIAENGYPVDFGAFDASFNLTIFPVTSIDVDPEYLINFSQRLRQKVRDSQFKCELADILISVVILNADVPSAKDSISWKRASRAYKIRRNINFFDWQNAKPKEKKVLLVNLIVDSLTDIPLKHLSEASKETLIKIVR